MIKPDSCNGCSLEKISDGWILSEGEGTSGVVVLGEAGGYNEYIDNLPFRPHAQAGSKLEEAFRIVQGEIGQPCSRNQFLLYNVVNCHPPGDKLAGMSYESGAIAHCSANVDRVVGGFNTNKNKTVLALGNIPLKFLTGFSGVAEEKQSISHLRGFVYKSKYGFVVPSLHPSFIRRGNNHLTPLLVEDIKKALDVAKGLYSDYPSYPNWIAPKYNVAPSLEDAWSFYYHVRDNENLPLTYDIETQDSAIADEDERDDLQSSEIVQIQFSYQIGMGIAFPWNVDYLPVIQALFRTRNVKANHNTWSYDNPRIRSKGVEILGRVIDTMWMFKHWHPRLPRGLQSVVSLIRFPFPWKHMYGSNLPWYGCADVDAVQWILKYLPRMMKVRGVWDGFIRHVVKVQPILERSTQIGIPVSPEKWIATESYFKGKREEVDKELQDIIPDEVRNIKPKRKDKETGEVDYGYIREPKIVREESDRYERLSKKLLSEGKRIVSFEDYLYRKHNLTFAEFKHVDGSIEETIGRWCIVESFKASKDQLVRYLKWKQNDLNEQARVIRERRDLEFGGRNPELTEQIKELEELAEDYEVPLDLKTKKQTTNKKELEEMYFNTGDVVLDKVVKIRSLDTNLNNFLPNWKPGKDGRVHPTYGYTAPTGQINSWGPNSQNVSKHTEFGNEFRGMIAAPAGYCFVELDKKSFHVGTLGYAANNRDYIRFSQIDPHSILGSYIDPSVIGCSISLKWSDAEIKQAANEFKKRCKAHKAKDPQHNIDVRQELAKPTVLGNQLELGAKKLQRQNRRFIHTIQEAERLQRLMDDLFYGQITNYKVRLKEIAFLQKFLINEFGRIQYFYDIFAFAFNKKQMKWTRREGEGAREPIAFRVQSPAFGMITEELLTLEEMGVCEEHNFLVTIHDSLMFMPEVGKKDKLIADAYDVMNRPCKYLVNDATGPEGLRVGVEVAVGKNWKGYDEKTNPEGMREV